MLALDDTGPFKLHNGLPDLGAILTGEAQFGLSGAGHAILGVFIYVAVGMAGDGDGLFPVAHAGGDAFHHHWRAEHRAVQYGADGTVGALPHLLEAVFLHALGVGGDGGAFDGYAVFERSLGAFHGDAVIRLIAVLQAQVIVFGLQVHIGQNQLVLDLLPQDAGHLVAVHLHQRRFHQNLVQNNPVPFAIVFDRTEGPKLLYRVCTGLAIRGTAKEQRACAAAGFVLSSRYAAGAPVKAPRKESSHDP